MAHLNTAISKVSSVFRIRTEGLGLRACARVFSMNRSTIADWEVKFAKQKDPLMFYGLCHEFISLTFEADELYTIIGKRARPHILKDGQQLLWIGRAALLLISVAERKIKRCFKVS